MFSFLKWLFGTAQSRTLKKFRAVVDQINDFDKQYQSLSDEALIAKTQEFKDRLQKGANVNDLLPEAFAVVKNACRRHIGTQVHVSGYDQKWDMVPFDVQLIGGIAMHNGSIAEMQTGEGKTLTAILPLYLNALTGKPVHLVTVNDYLAKRDCEWVGSILRWLGLTTGSLTNDVSPEQRHAVYQNDVVYGTASEFGFDYLRDNSMAVHSLEQVQRGFYFAIIDEVDSILIDEARTPLIISGPSPVSRQMYAQLKERVGNLVRLQRDFCNRLATEAKRVLDKYNIGVVAEDSEAKPFPNNPEIDEAMRKLWLVQKGTPHNKVLKRAKENPDVRAALDKWDLYYYSDSNKEEKAQALAELYLTIEERSSDFEITDKGIAAWQDSSPDDASEDFVMLDIAEEYIKIDDDYDLDAEAKMQRKLAVQEDDAMRKERSHNMRQLLRAHLLMDRDVDYIVQEGKIIIIDENTGRPQPGRRFSDGLHQAIEAKEGVAIQQETQTYATITLQNFFRMYDKLAGMSGTAITEANELKQIYKLDVLEIPTHKTCKRLDNNDEVYMSEREKYNAILKEVKDIHAQGRPILIGTESVEISEKLSRIFKQNNLPHTVLNAKHNDVEAEIIAQAGKRGAITISTNMAGRGTDIKLEAGVADVGGLHVLGTTRHQSRRTDRQLRGRCARQGDPGTSKFFISFEDSLMRLFASPRLTGMLQKFRPPEGEPISAGILNKSIETAQKRVEQRNYMMRKHTLEYDDVMNKQRHAIYSFRNEIIHSENAVPLAIEVIESVVADGAGKFFRSHSEEGGWNPQGYSEWLMGYVPITFEEGYFDQDNLAAEDLERLAADKISAAFIEKLDRENSKYPTELRDGVQVPVKPAEGVVRDIMIRRLDKLWQEHLLAMDHLRTEVNLRAAGNRDPLTEFKHEAFALFEEFRRHLHGEIVQALFRFQLHRRDEPGLQQVLKALGINHQLSLETNRSLISEFETANAAPNGSQNPVRATSSTTMLFNNPFAVHESEQEGSEEATIVGVKAPGRNDQCPCGSGKKYKKCCGAAQEEAS